MMTQRDPYVNMLRETIAAVAAGLGGADAVTVLPFTQAIGLPDRFARRVARNTQLLLIEESNLAKVADPAAGSGAIEDLTAKLCRKAWTLFQEIEQAGGVWAALEAGLIQKQVAAARAEREAAVARRKDALTGTSDFPDLAEARVAVLDVPPVAIPAYPVADPVPGPAGAAPDPAVRGAARRIRHASWRKPGRGRRCFWPISEALRISLPGPLSPRISSRSGGIEAVTNDGFVGRDEMVAAFKASGAAARLPVFVGRRLCAGGRGRRRGHRGGGARHIYLAGRPGERKAEFEAAGVQTFIYAGCDVLATLQAAHDILNK